MKALTIALQPTPTKNMLSPSMNSWAMNTVVITVSMPMSGCDFSSSRITPNTTKAIAMPGK